MIVWRSLIGFVVVLAGIQLIRPARTNPTFDPAKTINTTLPVDPAVAAILERSCKDCHSNRTVWPWYSGVAPASWLVIHDVNEGRGKMNLSEWGNYDSQEAHTLLGRMCREVSQHSMPIFAYTAAHRRTIVSDADAQTICDWTRRISP